MNTPNSIDDAQRVAIEQDRVEQAEAQRDAARKKQESVDKILSSQDEIDAHNVAVEQERADAARELRDANHDEDSVVDTNADLDETSEESKAPAKKATAKKAAAKKSGSKGN